MTNRRHFLTLAAGLSLAGGLASRVQAQGTGSAATFVTTTGDKLVAVVNGPGSIQDKRRELTQIIDGAVDVDGIAKFCLGRFWRMASPAQQQAYAELFHQVLVTNITARLGEYQGVRFTVGRSRQQDEEEVVSTVVDRPNSPPANVDWIIADPASSPKVIDVVAEGTSLRLTQRSDYSSYLAHNHNDINALISAMRQQAQQNNQ
jgi:phospholipid transport system substrate-binding protein